MPVKSLITLAVLSVGLSACSMFSSDKEKVAISPLPKISKVAAKPAHAKGVANCSTDGFCALPRKKKQASQ